MTVSTSASIPKELEDSEGSLIEAYQALEECRWHMKGPANAADATDYRRAIDSAIRNIEEALDLLRG